MEAGTQKVVATWSENQENDLLTRAESALDQLLENSRFKLVGDPVQIKQRLRASVLWDRDFRDILESEHYFSNFAKDFIYFPAANLCFVDTDPSSIRMPSKNWEKLRKDVQLWSSIGKRRHVGASKISFVSLSLSTSCNLACKYCFNDRGSYGIWRPRLMSAEQAVEAVRHIRNSSAFSNLVNLNLFGGEPLLNLVALQELASELTKPGPSRNKIHLSLTTNGTIFSEEISDFLMSYVGQITISMVPDKEAQDDLRPSASGTGSYESLIDSVSKWPDELRQRTSLAVTWSGDWKLDEFDDFCRHWGFRRVMVSLVQGTQDQAVHGESLITAFEDYYGRKIGRFAEDDVRVTTPVEEAFDIDFGYQVTRACGAGTSIASIDIDGNINGCYLFQHKPDMSHGSVRDGTQDHRKRLKFQSLVDPQSSSPCSRCRSINVCGGDCGYNRQNDRHAFLRCGHLRRMADLKLALVGACHESDVAHLKRICDDQVPKYLIF